MTSTDGRGNVINLGGMYSIIIGNCITIKTMEMETSETHYQYNSFMLTYGQTVVGDRFGRKNLFK